MTRSAAELWKKNAMSTGNLRRSQRRSSRSKYWRRSLRAGTSLWRAVATSGRSNRIEHARHAQSSWRVSRSSRWRCSASIASLHSSQRSSCSGSSSCVRRVRRPSRGEARDLPGAAIALRRSRERDLRESVFADEQRHRHEVQLGLLQTSARAHGVVAQAASWAGELDSLDLGAGEAPLTGRAGWTVSVEASVELEEQDRLTGDRLDEG